MTHTFALKAASRRVLLQSILLATLLFAILVWLHGQFHALWTPTNPLNYAAVYGLLFIFAVLQWRVHKHTLAKFLAGPSPPPETGSPSSPQTPPDKIDPETRANEQKRLFVHLFSVLQREGRLLDFLQEDLASYEDAQIGAAVRGVHEGCNKALARYLSAEPIMRQREGDAVEVPAEFDRQAIKLTGNVVGSPPFSGILRHRGWRLHSAALPKLSAMDNPDLIAPAEVEIP